jgi:Ca2+:H+ antiporter
MQASTKIAIWTIAAPVFGGAVLLAAGLGTSGGLIVAAIALGLGACVLAAVHHAEMIAHRVGEPFGSLVLALAVTLIEVALIVSLMAAGGETAAGLARDTVFATVMIILNGIVGLCLLVGGIRHREQSFSLDGASAALVALTTIVIMTLVFPNFTVAIPGPYYSPSQLTLIAIVTPVIYLTFIFTQTIEHREYFLSSAVASDAAASDAASPGTPVHASPPGNAVTALSGLLLLACLAIVVLLAKKLAPTLEAAVLRAGAPNALVGVIIAVIVLLPEALAALRAARANRLQTSLNLALGSALATIGLTIPAVGFLSLLTKTHLRLGINSESTVLLVLSLFVASMVLRTGRTIVLHGVVLLTIFVVYLFTTVVP